VSVNFALVASPTGITSRRDSAPKFTPKFALGEN
jgi:hypothetical protein